VDTAALVPQSALSLVNLTTAVFERFRDLRSHDDIVQLLGETNVNDVTEVPEIDAAMSLGAPSTEQVVERCYAFKHSERCPSPGLFDVAFDADQLVNFRGSVSFGGWFATRKAKRFLEKEMLPFIVNLAGGHVPSQELRALYATMGMDRHCYRTNGLVISAGRVPAMPTVSVYITDQDYM